MRCGPRRVGATVERNQLLFLPLLLPPPPTQVMWKYYKTHFFYINNLKALYTCQILDFYALICCNKVDNNKKS